MSKLSLEALKERAEAIASEELLTAISGGTESSCHIHYQCDNCTVTINKDGTIIIKQN